MTCKGGPLGATAAPMMVRGSAIRAAWAGAPPAFASTSVSIPVPVLVPTTIPAGVLPRAMLTASVGVLIRGPGLGPIVCWQSRGGGITLWGGLGGAFCLELFIQCLHMVPAMQLTVICHRPMPKLQLGGGTRVAAVAPSCQMQSETWDMLLSLSLCSAWVPPSRVKGAQQAELHMHPCQFKCM